jgi:plastocyanin
MRLRTPSLAVLALASASLATAIPFGAPLAAAEGKGHTYNVTIANMSFGKLPSELKVGDTITFTNQDTVPHTVTARDHSFDLRIAPRKSDTLTLKKAGSFPFYCIYHSGMRGTLTVTA